MNKPGLTSIEIVNIKGEKISSIFLGNLNSRNYEKIIDFSSYPSGIYWVSIRQYEFGNIINTESIPVTILK